MSRQVLSFFNAHFMVISHLLAIACLPLLARHIVSLAPQMADVLVLFAFCLSLYGVLGVQLFKGTLLYRCYGSDGQVLNEDAGVCPAQSEIGDGRNSICGAGETCRFYGTNPVSGTISFDNIFSALMTIFQCVTLEGWVDVMYAAIKVAGPLTALYFISLIALGAFYVLNLFLAVLVRADPCSWRTPPCYSLIAH